MWIRADLECALQSIGLYPGQTLIVHSSLKSIGWVVGGARTVVDALLAVLGPSGTLVMPAQSGENSDPAHWCAPPVPSDWWPAIREHTPPFDPIRTPPSHMGAIVECFRHYPGVLRSNHPLDSFIACGPLAEAILAEQPLESGLGQQSPNQKLYDFDAWILLIGVDYDRCTAMHLAEFKARSRMTLAQGSAILDSGRRIWRTYRDIALNSDEFLIPGQILEASGQVRHGKIGLADSRLLRVQIAVDQTERWLALNRHHRILPEEKQSILNELKSSPVENLFAIGDLENFSLEDEFFDALALYGSSRLDSLVIRYHNNIIVASPREDCRIEPVLSTIDHPSIQVISGRASLIEQLQPHRPDLHYRQMYLLAVDQASFAKALPDHSSGRFETSDPLDDQPACATLEDIPAIIELFTHISEFGQTGTWADRVQELQTAMLREVCHYYILRQDGRVIATAGTTAENSISAMIVGVATHPDHRGRGLASRLVSFLCRQTLGTRFQTLALFYDNPEAGRIYRRLGFTDAGDWMMAEKRKPG